jgi:uncharacterized protein YjbJ (UPF0337 family)
MGKLKELLGWATGDRHVEAEGRVEQKVADPANSLSEATPEVVRAEEKKVRIEDREVQPNRGGDG